MSTTFDHSIQKYMNVEAFAATDKQYDEAVASAIKKELDGKHAAAGEE